MRVDGKEQEGSTSRESPTPPGVGSGEGAVTPPGKMFFFLSEFSSVQNAEFYAFLLRKTTCGQKPRTGAGLIDPLGAENVNARGLKI